MTGMRTLAVAIVLVAAAWLMIPGQALATTWTDTWDGGGGNTNWATGDNWSGTPNNTVPDADAAVVINGAYTVNTASGSVAGTVALNRGTLNVISGGDLTVGGAVTVGTVSTSLLDVTGTLTTTGISLATNGTLKLEGNEVLAGPGGTSPTVSLAGSAIFNLNGHSQTVDTLTLTDAVSASAVQNGTLTVNTAINFTTTVNNTYPGGTVSANLVGSAPMTVSCSGGSGSYAMLSGDNSAYSGNITIGGSSSAIGLIAGSATALGSGSLSVLSAGYIILGGTTSLSIDKPVTINGGFMRNSANANTWSGDITLAGTNNYVQVMGGSLTISGSVTSSAARTFVTGGTFPLYLGQAGGNQFSDNISINFGGPNSFAGVGSIWDFQGYSETIAGLTMTFGTLRNGTITATSFSLLKGTVSANLVGSAQVNKTTADTVTLSGNNSGLTGSLYVGSASASGGELVGTSTNALGSTTATRTIDIGTQAADPGYANVSTLTFDGTGGNIVLSDKTSFLIQGSGVGGIGTLTTPTGIGAIRSLAGDNEIHGTITGGGTKDYREYIGVTAGSLTLYGAVNPKPGANMRDPDVSWAGNMSLYRKVGAGTLKFGASDLRNDSIWLMATVGTTDFLGHDDTISGLTVDGGAVTGYDSGTGHTTTLTIKYWTPSSYGQAAVRLKSGTLAVNIAETGGAIGLYKMTTSSFTLDGNNSYTGLTDVQAGTLVVGSNAALGTAAGGSSVTSGATLGISGAAGLSLGDALTLNGNGVSSLGALRSMAHNNVWSGDIVLGSDSAIGVDTGSTLSITGSIPATYALTKVGGGLLELTHATNRFTDVTVSAGTLKITGTLSTINTNLYQLTLAAGGVLSGTGSTDLHVTGSGLISPGNSPGILTLPWIDPSTDGRPDFAFELTQPGSPDYTAPTDSKNDVLRLTSTGDPFHAVPLNSDNAVDVYFDMSTLINGIYQGGWYTDLSTGFTGSIQSATYNYYVLGDGLGTDKTFNSIGYHLLTNYYEDAQVAVTTVDSGYRFSDSGETGSLHGYVTQFTVSGAVGAGGAVPEPAALSLIGLVLLALGKRRRG